MQAREGMGQSLPGGRNSECKGPEVGNCSLCWGQGLLGGGEVSRVQVACSLEGCSEESGFLLGALGRQQRQEREKRSRVFREKRYLPPVSSGSVSGQ